MKTRQGFVSNSSSSSFIVFGKYVSDEERKNVDYNKLEEEGYSENCSEDGICIGIDPDEMKDEETLLQFKTRIAEDMKKIGLTATPKELRFIGGEGYDNY